MEEIMVSVICTTYNQKNYISRCLESLVSQKTSFRYEIIVHDDASNDGTANIVREYANKYPELIVPILQKENQYSKQKGSVRKFIDPLVRGKYRAHCEGDDFWCDEEKLQKQYKVMEANQNCSMCVHSTKRVNDVEIEVGESFPNIDFKEGVVSTQHMIDSFPEWSFHLSSFFIREAYYKKIYTLDRELFDSFPVGDIRILYCMAVFGDYYYIEKAMSCYTVNAQNSWTRRQNKKSLNEFNNKMILMSNLYMKYLQKERPEVDVTNIKTNVIPYYEFQILIYDKKYKQLLGRKYKKFFEDLNCKFKAKIYLLSFFPALDRIIGRKKQYE